MRYKVRIQKALIEYQKELKELKKHEENDNIDIKDANNKDTMKMIRDKAQIKAKCIIDHLELRSLDASKIADELLMHYEKTKDLMIKSLIIAMILVCMTKWNKQIGKITKNILAAQADTVLTTILLDSLNKHKQYDEIIILTLECLQAYLETWKVYKQGIFKESDMLSVLFTYTKSSNEVQIYTNKTIYSLVMFWSIETINQKLNVLIEHGFNTINQNQVEFEKSEVDVPHESADVEHASSYELSLSGVKILQAISWRYESASVESSTFLTVLFKHFDSMKWSNSNYIVKWFEYVTTQQKTQESEAQILPKNINKIIMTIYNRISSDGDDVLDTIDKESAIRNLQVNGMPLNHSVDSFRKQLICMWKSLSVLYNIRGDSLALNHASDIVFDVYRKLWDLEPVLESEEESKSENDSDQYTDSNAASESSFISNIVAAFHSYADNLWFKYSINRYKIAQSLIKYGEAKGLFDELTAPDSNEVDKYRIYGTWNYLQLIQLAVSIMYVSSTTFLNTNAIKNNKDQVCSFAIDDFDTLFNPIKEAIATKSTINSRITNQIFDCIAKMLKYQQVFMPDDSLLFASILKSLSEVLKAHSFKVPVIFAVFAQLSVSNPQSVIGNLLPSFLKSFDSDVTDNSLNSGRSPVDYKAYKAVWLLKMANTCAEVSKSDELKDLVEEYLDKTGVDLDNRDFQRIDSISWTNEFVDKFTDLWEEYRKNDDMVDNDDIKVDYENVQEAVQEQLRDNSSSQQQKMIMSTLIKQMDKTASRSVVDHSNSESHSVQAYSSFSLDQAENSSEDEQNLVQYVKNMNDFSESIDENRSVTISNHNYDI